MSAAHIVVMIKKEGNLTLRHTTESAYDGVVEVGNSPTFQIAVVTCNSNGSEETQSS